jgi:hypothetical protein
MAEAAVRHVKQRINGPAVRCDRHGITRHCFHQRAIGILALGEEPNDITLGEDSAQLLLAVDDKR